MAVQTKRYQVLTSNIMLIAWVAGLSICVRRSDMMDRVNAGVTALLTTTSNTMDNPTDLLPVRWILQLEPRPLCYHAAFLQVLIELSTSAA